MDKIMQYSKEWFALNGAKVQNNAIENLKSSAYYFDILKDHENTFEEGLFLGTKDEIKEKYNVLEGKTDFSSRAQANFIELSGGLDAICNVLDSNNDGIISPEELSAAAATDTPEFAEADKNFSMRDLGQIYENALAAQGAVVELTNSVDTYKYKDGTTTQIKKDDKGQIYEKNTEKTATNGEKIGSYVYYDKEAIGQYTKDSKGRFTSYSYDAKGKVNDKTINTSYDDKNKIKKVVTETAGRTINETYINEVLKEKTQTLKYTSDGEIKGKTEQQTIGDCWALAGIQALNSTKKGREIIKNSIKQNDDGSVTVTLKGVNKKYTFTPEEIGAHDYTNLDFEYSKGDIDMVLFEMGINELKKEQIAEGVDDIDANDPLNGGYRYEAFDYLTDIKSEYKTNTAGFKKMLSNKEKNVEKYAMTAGFKEKDSSIGDIVPRHTYSITKVTKDDVYVINPWDSSVEIKYPKKKFLENVNGIASIEFKDEKK